MNAMASDPVNRNSQPDSVFLGPLLDNVLKAGPVFTKASLGFHGIFFDRLLIADAPLLNNRLLYKWYMDKHARHYLESWLSTKYLVPCLRNTAGDFVELLEIQDKQNMLGKITDIAENRENALLYARFLDGYSKPQKFPAAQVAANFTQTIQDKFKNDAFLTAAGLHDLGDLLAKYIEFLMDTSGKITRTQLYNFSKPKNKITGELNPDVRPFADHYGIKANTLSRKITLHSRKIKSLVDAIYNGNLPFTVLGSSLVVPVAAKEAFTLAWYPIESEAMPHRSKNLNTITLDPTLLLTRGGMAKVTARQLETLRLSPEWKDYISSLRADENSYISVGKYAQTASSYITELLIEKTPILNAMRTAATLVNRIRESSQFKLWEIGLTAARHQSMEPDFVAPPESEMHPWGLEYYFTHAEHILRERHLRRSAEIGECVKADIHMAVSTIGSHAKRAMQKGES